MKKSILREYARLIARSGVNIQPGQEVFITAELDQPEFVKMLVEECYKCKAKKVVVDWDYQPLQKLHFRYRTLTSLSKLDNYEEARWQHYVDTIPCRIYLLSEDPDGLKGIDQEKLAKSQQAKFPIIKPYRDQIENKYQWCIAAVPGEAWAKKLFPQFKDNISMALTPMVITARMVKKDRPNARIVFIGPCAAKKLEANRKSVRSDVDFVLTFEELQGMFDAKEIKFAQIEADPADSMDEGSGFGRGFAVGGGVAAAVVEAIKHIDPTREIQVEYGDGLRECKKMLMMAKAGKRNGFLLEGMGCPGGCVAGVGTIAPVKDSTTNVERFKNAAAVQSTTESPYLDRLKDVEESC